MKKRGKQGYFISRKTILLTILLAAGLLIFLLSYYMDSNVAMALEKISMNPSLMHFNSFLSIATNFTVVVIIMLIIPSLYFYSGKKHKQLKMLWISFAAAVLLSFILKIVFQRERPAYAPYPLWFFYYSFPSLHSTAAFSSLRIITDNYKSLKVYFILYAVIAAFSRLYFSLHYLSDVVFGMLLGHFISYFTISLMLENGKTRKAGKA